MKIIGFIGAYDKTDFMIYVAKALTMLEKKIIIVDSTSIQKARYIVPAINPTKAYVTEYEGIDVAIGFENFEEIKKYLGTEDGKDLEYDMALVDVDSSKIFEQFNINNGYKNYFVTSFDLYALKKGIEILNLLPEPTKLTKIIFSKDMLKEDNEYLDYLSLGSKAIWNEEYIMYLPIDKGDQNVIIENQRVSKIGIRKLSQQYKDSLEFVVEDIADDVPSGQVKKVFKQLEKEV